LKGGSDVKIPRLVVWAGVLVIGWWGLAGAQEAGGAAKHTYVGVKKCKMCHNKEASGGQYAKWMASKHSKAFSDLAGDSAMAIAKAKGIADPQKADECLGCHTTGHGEKADMFGTAFVAADGVQCEACHGPGSDYLKMKTMKGIWDGSLKAADYGLQMPTKETCAHCHNEKATGGQFVDWPKDSTKIAHSIPKDYKPGAAKEE
jgi:hypothetical protein